MDHQGLIVDFNEMAERTFGHTAAAVRGRLLADVIIPPDLRRAHASGLERYLKTRKSDMLGKRIEVPALRRDGRTIPVEVAISEVNFTTSLFPRDGTYLLPLKDAVRRAANLTSGDRIAVRMAVRISDQ